MDLKGVWGENPHACRPIADRPQHKLPPQGRIVEAVLQVEDHDRQEEKERREEEHPGKGSASAPWHHCSSPAATSL